MRILYSFANKIGADRICYTAWEQVKGLCAAGADVLVMPGAVHRPIPGNPEIQPTLSAGNIGSLTNSLAAPHSICMTGSSPAVSKNLLAKST